MTWSSRRDKRYRDAVEELPSHQRRVFNLTLGHCAVLQFYGSTTVLLLEGSAACLGVTLRPHASVAFSRRGVTIDCTSATCRVEVSGYFTWEEELSDSSIADVHAALDAARVAAATSGGRGPVAVLVGNTDTGKSTLALQLVNRALTPVAGRDDDKAKFGVAQVELDIGQAGMACPGSLSATFMRKPLPPDDDHTGTVPLSFFFGDKTLQPDTAPRYAELCVELRKACDNVAGRHKEFAAGGVVANTMGWTEGLGLEALQQAIDGLRATHVIVVGNNDALATHMKQLARSTVRGLTVLEYTAGPRRLSPRSTAKRIEARDSRIAEYFCGTPHKPLTPVRLVVSVADLVILDALTHEAISYFDVEPRSLAAVSHGKTIEQAKHANAAGFVVILDIGEKALGVLAPMGGPLPSNVLLVSPSIRLSAGRVPIV